MSGAASFSVVVPTLNRPRQLLECARAVAALDYPRDRLELVVVDDGGREPLDPVLEPVREEIAIRLIRQENEGPASARNLGVRSAEGALIAFTDDDCRPAPDWLRRLAEVLDGAPDTLAGGRTVNALADNPYSESSQLLVSYLYEYYAEDVPGRFFTSNNMGVHRDTFLRVGGFDVTELRATAEDRELCDRWRHDGLELVYAPEALVYHAHSLDLRSFVRQHFNYGRGALYYHDRRAERGSGRIRLEPPSFYGGLVTYPLGRTKGPGAIRQSCLMGLSQVANAAGYFRERWSRSAARRHD